MKTQLACAALLLLTQAPGHSLFADQRPGTGAPIPFKLIRNFLIVVPVFIDGAGPYEFALDTGTNTTLLDPGFARRLGLRPSDRMLLLTVTGAEAVPRSRLARLALGPRSAAEVEVLWVELGEIRALSPGVCGVLGQNFLSGFNYLIDYRRRQIQFDEGGELAENLGGARLPIESDEGRMLIAPPAHAPLRLALDSGASGMVLFEEGARLLAPALDGGAYAEVRAGAAGTRVQAGRLPALRLGAETLRDLAVAVAPGGARAEGGLLPLSLFRAVYFNHREGYLIFNPR